ncbi:ribose transport system ATP-binding protein [Burkholderia sp. OK233]|nr:ribose transport system ATP-binding protein [Burkholderia sp. OK233]
MTTATIASRSPSQTDNDPPRHPPRGAALELRGIRKNFGSVQALQSVNLALQPGEVHAIVGENGAGKSTLINVAAGILRPDTGEIVCGGELVLAATPVTMCRLGVAVAYQHPALAPDLSLYENIQLIGAGRSVVPTLSEVNQLIERVAIPALRMKPSTRVADLSLPQLHVAEIVRALASRPRVLFLDEPTEPFRDEQVSHLFDLIDRLREDGVALAYVSHRLHEVIRIADRMSIMRDGQIIETRRSKPFSIDEVVTLIAGRPIDQLFPHKARTEPGELLIEAKRLSGSRFSDVDMSFREGEIVGITGIEGQGQREFLRAIAGLVPFHKGKLLVEGQRIRPSSPARARARGVGFIPDDRHSEGLFLPMSIRENLNVGLPSKVIDYGFVLNAAADAQVADEVITRLHVKTSSAEVAVQNLSGGNQQKVLLGREMVADPSVLLVDEPTKGVDVGARKEIYQLLRDAAASRKAVVVSSSDGAELEGLCDRILVFSRGKVVSELTGKAATDAAITDANVTATVLRGEAAPKNRYWSRNLLSGLHLPTFVLVLLSVLIVCTTAMQNPYFIDATNLRSMLQLLSILAFVGAGQLCVMLMGDIDLSLGPLAGLVVVLCSFLLPQGVSDGALLTGAVSIIAMCCLFGLLQGILVEVFKLPSVVVTLSSFIGLQGLSLLLRPRPVGTISDRLTDIVQQDLAGVPITIGVTLLALAVLELMLFRSPWGRALRAAGSSQLASYRLGVNRALLRIMAFSLAACLTGCGGLILASEIGIGSATTGVSYTLSSITAVVLSGAAVTGGRGSFVGMSAAAALIVIMTSATSFFQTDAAWQYWLVGGMTVLASVMFGAARRTTGQHAGT